MKSRNGLLASIGMLALLAVFVSWYSLPHNKEKNIRGKLEVVRVLESPASGLIPYSDVKIPALVANCVGEDCSTSIPHCMNIASSLKKTGVVRLVNDTSSFEWRVFFRCSLKPTNELATSPLWSFIHKYQTSPSGVSNKLIEGFPNYFPIVNNKVEACKIFRKNNLKLRDFTFECFIPTMEAKEDLKNWCSQKPNAHVIVKVEGASGQGIRGLQNCSQVIRKPELFYAQEYLSDPLRINNRKFDIRAFVLVTSIEPIRLYFSRTSFCRFALTEWTGTFDNDHLLEHLTGPYQASHSNKYPKNIPYLADGEPGYPFMSYEFFMSTLEGKFGAGRADEVQNSIKHALREFLVPLLNELRHETRKCPACFALFGADVAIDSTFKAKVIESNVAPYFGVGPAEEFLGNLKHSQMSSLLRMLRIDPNVPYVQPRHLIWKGVSEECAATVSEIVNEITYAGVYTPVATTEYADECVKQGVRLAMRRHAELFSQL